MSDVIKEAKKSFEGIVAWFREEVSSLRTGRATPALVEDLEVESYGSKMPLKHVASISTPDSRTIVIQPWDKSVLEGIAKAIENSNLSLQPIPDQDVIRIALPQLTAERRKGLVKVLNEKAEEARVRSRRGREEALKTLERLEKEHTINEDEKFRGKAELQKEIDAFNAALDDVRKKKETEIEEL